MSHSAPTVRCLLEDEALATLPGVWGKRPDSAASFADRPRALDMGLGATGNDISREANTCRSSA